MTMLQRCLAPVPGSTFRLMLRRMSALALVPSRQLRCSVVGVGLALLAGVGVRAQAQAPEAALPPVELAILGDSLSTGAVTHPALAFDGQVLWDIFSGKVGMQPKKTDLPPAYASKVPGDLVSPQRYWPGTREFFGGPDWVWRNALQSISRSYLDTAEYSWGYMLGLGLGLRGEQIALAGEDGARVANIPRHVDRVLAAGGGVLPRRMVVYYTGNDLCGASLAEVSSDDDYAADLELGLRYLARNGRAAAGGTDVYVPAYLGIVQLIISDSILAKKVRAFGGETTCRKLREQGFRPTADEQKALGVKNTSPEAWYFSLVMPPSPAGFCATLFAGGDDAEREHVTEALANHIRAYREKQVAIVEKLNAEQAHRADAPTDAVRFHFLPATGSLTFTGDDIAQDCFHLSVFGQAKVAAALQAGMSAH